MTAPRPHAELNKHKVNQVPLMSAAEVNALPPKAREYIHQLESNADPAGMVRENMQLWDTNNVLQVMYRNRTDELDRVQQDLEKANSSAEHFEREWCLRGDELDNLRAQLAEAQRDSERLDWMIEQCAYVVSDPDCCDGYWLNYPRKDGTLWTQATEHETPRAAIDAAKGGSNAA